MVAHEYPLFFSKASFDLQLTLFGACATDTGLKQPPQPSRAGQGQSPQLPRKDTDGYQLPLPSKGQRDHAPDMLECVGDLAGTFSQRIRIW